MEEAAVHRSVAEDTDGSRVGIGKDGLRAMLLRGQREPGWGQAQGFVPRDGLEGIELMPDGKSPFQRSLPAAHGVEQSGRRVDTVEIFGYFAAQEPARHRVRRVALHLGRFSRPVN